MFQNMPTNLVAYRFSILKRAWINMKQATGQVDEILSVDYTLPSVGWQIVASTTKGHSRYSVGSVEPVKS